MSNPVQTPTFVSSLINPPPRVLLVSHSFPDIKLHDDTIQELVAFCARVSNPSHQYTAYSSMGLIKYLIKHKHWSPFEMVSICLEITTTRDIARQILRHRSFSFQEFSQRYADPTLVYNWCIREARLQDPKNRQNSIELEKADSKDTTLEEEWYAKQQQVIDTAVGAYQWAIAAGIAKEQARCVLPEGCTPSTVLVNGSLRSWLHYIDLRLSNGTQKEHRIVAEECAKVISSLFPLIQELVGKSNETKAS